MNIGLWVRLKRLLTMAISVSRVWYGKDGLLSTTTSSGLLSTLDVETMREELEDAGDQLNVDTQVLPYKH